MTRRLPSAVFLDRDGTINRKADEGDYVKSPAELELLPGAAEAIRRLNLLGAPVVVVTNQRGIALRRMSDSDLQQVHERLRQLLAEGGACVDAIYHCPHDRDVCDCRKPGTALFVRAANELNIDLDRSIVIGDTEADTGAAERLNVRSIRIGADAPTLLDAVESLAREWS